MIVELLSYAAAGAVVGLAVGITGVGGGSLMTPLLLLFGVPLHIAIGTDLLFAAITKAGGVVAHARQRTVAWRLVLLLAAGSLPASAMTVLALHRHFDAGSDATLLTSALGLMLILTALAIFGRDRLRQARWAPRLESWMRCHGPLTLVGVGALLGVGVTLSSVGAGAFGAALLMLLLPGLSGRRVVGTDIAHAVPLTLVAGLGHLALGHVDLVLLAALLSGSLPAIAFGSRLAVRIPEGVMRPLLAALLMALGVKFAML